MNPLLLFGVLAAAGYGLARLFQPRRPVIRPTAPQLPPTTPTTRRPPPPSRECIGTGTYVTTPASHRNQYERSLRIELCESPLQPQMPGQFSLDAAEDMAPQLEQALLANLWSGSYAYDILKAEDPANARGADPRGNNPTLQRLVKDFQALMNLEDDGKYGPSTAGALMFVTGRAPPPPMFTEPRIIQKYQPVGYGVQR